MIITSEIITSEIKEAYDDPNHQKLAELAYNAGVDWASNQPVNWNDQQARNRLELRRERRQKKNELHQHITNKMADVNPSQFVIPSFIFSYILSSIISWVVKQILSHYWPDNG